MATLLRVVDEHFGGGTSGRVRAGDLRLASERVSAREIIRRRVEAEVAELNSRNANAANVTRSFLVSAGDNSVEAVLNPAPSVRHRPKPIDAEKETGRAIEAFSRNRFILLFNDRQLEGLDDEVGLTPDAEVVFLFLTPLKGG
jgi:hypothetical protein